MPQTGGQTRPQGPSTVDIIADIARFREMLRRIQDAGVPVEEARQLAEGLFGLSGSGGGYREVFEDYSINLSRQIGDLENQIADLEEQTKGTSVWNTEKAAERQQLETLKRQRSELVALNREVALELTHLNEVQPVVVEALRTRLAQEQLKTAEATTRTGGAQPVTSGGGGGGGGGGTGGGGTPAVSGPTPPPPTKSIGTINGLQVFDASGVFGEKAQADVPSQVRLPPGVTSGYIMDILPTGTIEFRAFGDTPEGVGGFNLTLDMLTQDPEVLDRMGIQGDVRETIDALQEKLQEQAKERQKSGVFDVGPMPGRESTEVIEGAGDTTGGWAGSIQFFEGQPGVSVSAPNSAAAFRAAREAISGGPTGSGGGGGGSSGSSWSSSGDWSNQGGGGGFGGEDKVEATIQDILTAVSINNPDFAEFVPSILTAWNGLSEEDRATTTPRAFVEGRLDHLTNLRRLQNQNAFVSHPRRARF